MQARYLGYGIAVAVATGAFGAPAAEAAPGVDASGSWDRLADCEASGNWHINSGNGYYGGLQISGHTWRAFGGDAYASRADQASRSQQIDIATRVLDYQGLGAWPDCSPRTSGLAGYRHLMRVHRYRSCMHGYRFYRHRYGEYGHHRLHRRRYRIHRYRHHGRRYVRWSYRHRHHAHRMHAYRHPVHRMHAHRHPVHRMHAHRTHAYRHPVHRQQVYRYLYRAY